MSTLRMTPPSTSLIFRRLINTSVKRVIESSHLRACWTCTSPSDTISEHTHFTLLVSGAVCPQTNDELIREMNDRGFCSSYFRALSLRQPMYECLVEGCGEKFTSDATRSKHLRRVRSLPNPDSHQHLHASSLLLTRVSVSSSQVHQYPKSFSFHHRAPRTRSKVASVTLLVSSKHVTPALRRNRVGPPKIQSGTPPPSIRP